MIPSYIATRGDLLDAEQRNIVRALLLPPPTVAALLDDKYLRDFHKAMFGRVWRWAGRYRSRETNLGIGPEGIAAAVRILVGDAAAWVEHDTYEPDELAVRFHHRLVSIHPIIHPFLNGNGRHSRICADMLVTALGREPFSWGNDASVNAWQRGGCSGGPRSTDGGRVGAQGTHHPIYHGRGVLTAGVEAGARSPSGRFRWLLEELHRSSGRRVVVLVDEYDKPILDALSVSGVARSNRDFLRGFYAVLKDADEHVRFVFLTGVSKFSKVSLFSGLNNLRDITLNPAYSSVCGFTEADLDRVFAAELRGLDREKVREWYNGYSWLGTERVYNPYDVLMLLVEREFKAHWFETGSPAFLVNTLIERGVPPATLGDAVTTARLLSAFDVDHIATEALLFQTGYLTIAGTEECDGETYYRLAYPNFEVRKSLSEALLERLADDTQRQTARSRELRRLLRIGDAQGLRPLFEDFFSGVPHQWHASGRAAEYESYYATVFYICFAALGLDVAVEEATSRGRIDMTVRTPHNIWLFEFKTTRTSPQGAAMQQLLDRGYADKYRSHSLPITLVGIEFDPRTRNIANYETTTT